MNREIKFRGFVKELNQWVVGDLLSNNNQPIIVKQVERNYISTTDVGQGKHWAIETPAYKVVPESVGQYVKTSTNRGISLEVFNKDFVLVTMPYDDNKYKAEIYYDDSTCAFRAKVHRNNGVYLDFLTVLNVVEIIGNLFQTPELLKQ